MSVPVTIDDHARKCRAAVLAFVAKHPACAGRAISEELFGGRVSRRDITNAIGSLVRDKSLSTSGPDGAPRYSIGTPVVEDDSEAIAHLRSCGDLGDYILELAAEQGISPTALLTAKQQNVGRMRGRIIAAVSGSVADIAKALRISEATVKVYRSQAA